MVEKLGAHEEWTPLLYSPSKVASLQQLETGSNNGLSLSIGTSIKPHGLLSVRNPMHVPLSTLSGSGGRLLFILS